MPIKPFPAFHVILASAVLCCSSGARAQACIVAATPVVFSTYDPFNASPTDSSGSVTVTCQAAVSVLVSYTIKLDGGGAGSVAGRRMTSGASQLFYQIYTSAARTSVWGDGTGGSVTQQDGYLLGVLVPVAKSLTTYARLSARQNVPPGNYSDAVTVQVTY